MKTITWSPSFFTWPILLPCCHHPQQLPYPLPHINSSTITTIMEDYKNDDEVKINKRQDQKLKSNESMTMFHTSLIEQNKIFLVMINYQHPSLSQSFSQMTASSQNTQSLGWYWKRWAKYFLLWQLIILVVIYFQVKIQIKEISLSWKLSLVTLINNTMHVWMSFMKSKTITTCF